MTTARQALLAVLCVLAALGAHLLTPRQLLADLEPVNLEQMVPLQFGDWKALPQHDDVITSPEQEAFIKSIYSQTLSRVYADSQGHRVMLSIAYTRDQSDNAGTQSHKPEICYPAQGFQIVSKQIGVLDDGPEAGSVVRMVAVNGSRIEPLTYWLMIGHDRAVSHWDVKRWQMAYGLHDQIPDGLIFRVSVIGEDIRYGFALQQQFLQQLFSGLSPMALRRLAGIDG